MERPLYHETPERYDVVRAKIVGHPVSGRMNSYNKQIESRIFEGYAIVLNTSDSFANVYLPNKTQKLIMKKNLVVIIKYKKE